METDVHNIFICRTYSVLAMTGFPGSAVRTPLCNMLGVKYPIIQAGMAGGITTPELVSAVSEAGSLGMLALARLTPEQTRENIRKVKSLTSKPFGVNFLLAPPEKNDQSIPEIQNILNNFRSELELKPSETVEIQLPESKLSEQYGIVLEEKVSIVSFALGNPRSLVEEAHSRGIKVIAMVTTVEEAKEVISEGTDFIVAQGSEAGGHRSTFKLDANKDAQAIGTMALVPQVVDVAHDVPVIAAGGIMNGRGIAASFALGAQGVQLGTRFLTATESGAFPAYKKTLAKSTETDTLITKALTGRPARTVRNRFVDEFEKGCVKPLAWPYQGIAADDIYMEAARKGNSDYFPLLAGQGLRMLKQEQSAAQIIEELVRETEEALQGLSARMTNC